jgi:transposase
VIEPGLRAGVCLEPYRRQLVRLGLEAGPLLEWLVRGLAAHGLVAVLMETRQVRAVRARKLAVAAAAPYAVS